MGRNPILLKSSQIDKRADTIRAADIVVDDAAATADIPGNIGAAVVTPDAP